MSLTYSQLLALLTDLESDRVERKESFKGDAPDKVRQAVCAFANDLSGRQSLGVVFIGARDKDGEPTGIEVIPSHCRRRYGYGLHRIGL